VPLRLVEGSGRTAVVRIEDHSQTRARGFDARSGEAPVTTIQLTVDCADPQAMARFWLTALHYVAEPPPPGHETLGVVVGRDGGAAVGVG